MVFDAATALDTAIDMVDPQPRLVERLVRHVLLPRELLPQIEINSIDERRHVELTSHPQHQRQVSHGTDLLHRHRHEAPFLQVGREVAS